MKVVVIGKGVMPAKGPKKSKQFPLKATAGRVKEGTVGKGKVRTTTRDM